MHYDNAAILDLILLPTEFSVLYVVVLERFY